MAPGAAEFSERGALRAARGRRLSISLTPLIDVVFILLVFFMLASSFSQWRSLSLSAARPAAGAAAASEGAMLVEVTEEGVRLAGEALSPEAFGARIAARLEARPEQRFLLRAAPGVALQPVVDALDQMDALGARNVTLAVAGGR